MSDDSRYAKHTRLVLNMADSQGIDLPELVMRAEFSMEDMERAVEKCTGCTHPEDCARLLDTATEQVSLPQYCRNGDMFDMLKPQ